MLLTWKTCAELSIMTPAEREAFFASEPPQPHLLRLVLQDYVRPNSRRLYPGLSGTVVTDIENATRGHHIEFAALLKAAIQRHILDAFKGEYLLKAGITPMEARIHADAYAHGLTIPESTVWNKMVEELYRERPWPWDNGAELQSNIPASAHKPTKHTENAGA